MFNIQYRNNQDVITERTEGRIPIKGECIAFFSYNKDLEKQEMQLNEYYVVQTISMLRDPAPPEGFVSDNIGTERYLVFLQPKADYEAAIIKRINDGKE